MNKNLLLFLIITYPVLAFSQDDTLKKKSLILASISFELGRTIDRYAEMDLDMMHDFTQNPTELDRNLTGYSETQYEDVAGSKMGVSIALIPFDQDENDYSTTREIRVGLLYSARGTSLSYLLSDTSGAFQSVNYSTRFKELSANGAYVWKYCPKFAQRFTLHGGIGLGIGSTLYDKTSVAEHISSGEINEIPSSLFNVYKGKSSLFARAYTPIGIDFALAERFDIGVQSAFGIALQQVYNGESYLIPLSGSLAVKVSFYF